ncbi:hypothetical protein FHX64_002554 [Microbacter margulisiae]|uniref:Uncharacterized protein n=1 Tax=Microbacter margulisiae TaxID=1350067 RepID=A0A7W5DSZ1_9PORP|nr:hypothetical protein [Microbacter margulisiae]
MNYAIKQASSTLGFLPIGWNQGFMVKKWSDSVH